MEMDDNYKDDEVPTYRGHKRNYGEDRNRWPGYGKHASGSVPKRHKRRK